MKTLCPLNDLLIVPRGNLLRLRPRILLFPRNPLLPPHSPKTAVETTTRIFPPPMATLASTHHEVLPTHHRPQAPHALDLKSSSLPHRRLTATWNKEGPWGVWKGTNSTYVYSILLSTLTSFSKSFLAAVLSLPDPGLSSQLSALSSRPSSLDLGSATGIDILSSETPSSPSQ